MMTDQMYVSPASPSLRIIHPEWCTFQSKADLGGKNKALALRRLWQDAHLQDFLLIWACLDPRSQRKYLLDKLNLCASCTEVGPLSSVGALRRKLALSTHICSLVRTYWSLRSPSSSPKPEEFGRVIFIFLTRKTLAFITNSSRGAFS